MGPEPRPAPKKKPVEIEISTGGESSGLRGRRTKDRPLPKTIGVVNDNVF